MKSIVCPALRNNKWNSRVNLAGRFVTLIKLMQMQGLGATRCFACYNVHAHKLRCLNLPRVTTLLFSSLSNEIYRESALFFPPKKFCDATYARIRVYIYIYTQCYGILYKEHTYTGEQFVRESRCSSHFSVNYWHGKWRSKGSIRIRSKGNSVSAVNWCSRNG